MNRKRAVEPQEPTAGKKDVIRDGRSMTARNAPHEEGLVEHVATGRKEENVLPHRVTTDATTLRDGGAVGTSTVGAVAGETQAGVPRVRQEATLNRPIPSMINDSTGDLSPTTDSMMTDSAASRVIAQVRVGMTVVDADGEELGKVDHVNLGDQGAATVGADAPVDPGFLGTLFAVEAEPAVAEPHRSRLLRFGFVKVDGKGWFDTDRYLRPGMIAAVVQNTVRLRVRKNEILTDEV